ncbi:autotransporter serine protease [Cognatiluteimonas weifangensis]|nr:autotransporter serine protease [Luteimonas weifangensis]
MPQHDRLSNSSALSALACAIALALSACGGGGSNVRAAPPPAPPAAPGIGFTPTVATDSSLTQANPPAVPSRGAPVTFSSPSLSGHLILTNAAGALGAGLKGKGVTIGLVDSGVNRNHPTLSGRVTRNFVHVDPDANDLSVDDKIGHGTIVASLAAGKPAIGNYLNPDGSNSGQTGQWGGGVAQEATIVSSRIIGDTPPVDDGSGQGNEIGAGQGYGDFFKAINAELADAGAKIINNSWGGLYWNDPALTTELANAWKDFVVARGGIIVFANGNAGEDPALRLEPSDNARLPTLANDAQLESGWLTVGALDPDNPTQLTSYSQECGSAMNYCLVAPGNVVFIDPDATSQATSGLYRGGGTSFAAPQVAGAAAVVWSAFPYFDNDLVRQTILGAAKDLGEFGVDPVFGWGLLDVTKAANGPSKFAWGDVSVSFSGTSVWRNQISGDGGLVKSGPGTLILTQIGGYLGDTRVLEGGLYLSGGAGFSDIFVSQGATVWSGGFAMALQNDGTYLAGASGTVGARSFTQGATGNLGVWLGNTFLVTGPAALDGQVSVLGVKQGYVTASRETLLNAHSISGTFDSLKAAPNVFLDASLSYDPNNVFLDIKRIDVTKAVAGMGLSGITMASAERVETAMGAIDSQLAGIAPAGIDGAFIDAAGALQHSTSVANADLSLRSLSGQLHAASSALTFDSIDATRRALDARVERLGTSRHAAGGWYRDLATSGTLAQAGYDGVALDAQGEMIGNDWRAAGGDAVFGLAMSRVRQANWLGAFGDRSRGEQREVQLYAAGWHGDWYGQAQLALGGFDRQMQRNLLLGARQDTVATTLLGRYQSAFAEVGRRFDVAGVALSPYAGSQYAQIDNAGFAERGETGFGLRADAWNSRRWQGFAGLRAQRGWRLGGVDLRADTRAEWQRTLASQGELFQASFTGLSQWAPVQGIGLAEHGVTFGAGLSALFGDDALLRLDAVRRSSPLGGNNTVSLQGFYRF